MAIVVTVCEAAGLTVSEENVGHHAAAQTGPCIPGSTDRRRISRSEV